MQLFTANVAAAEGRVVRPPVPRTNPRHDYFGPRPADQLTIEQMLGTEHFTKPKPVKVTGEPLLGIGDLARMMGRTTPQIRNWIRDGVIPEATHWAGDKRRFTQRQAFGLLSLLSRE